MPTAANQLSKGQQRTKALVEERLGKPIPEHLIKPFFAKTDRGIKPEENTLEFREIMFAFKMIAWDYNNWVEGFRTGLLFFSEFIGEDEATKELATRAFVRALKLGRKEL